MKRRMPLAVRIYASALLLFPAAFRRRYGGEMVFVFADEWSRASGAARMRLLARGIGGALVHGISERIGRGRSADHGRMTMRGWTQDVRFALRGFRRRPGFSAVAVATIALGIGAASAVFAVVDAVVFRPLPYPQADRLVAVWTTFEGQGDFAMSLAEQYDYAEESRALEAMGSFSVGSSTLTGSGDARRVSVAWTWGDLNEVIGAQAVLGRLPTPAESSSGASPVVVVSHDFWTASLGGVADVVGRTLDLDGGTVEIIGVMAPDVRLPEVTPDLWRPVARDRSSITDRSGHGYEGIGRLAPGATIETLRTEMDQILERWHEVWAGVHSPGHPGHSLAASGLHERYFGNLRASATMLLGAVLMVLLLACVNVASMLLARGEARAADLALRRALGAGRGRIIRQLLIESLALSLVGGALGLALAAFGAQALMVLEPGDLPRASTVGLDPRVTAFAAIVSALSGLVFGVVPALRGGRGSVRGGRPTAGPDRSLSRSLGALVVAQVALAIVLLAGAGLLSRSVLAMAGADVGIETGGRLTFRLALPAPSYPGAAEVDELWRRVVSDTESLPGVDAAAVVRLLPLRDGLRREGMEVEGREIDVGDMGAVAYGTVTPGYFSVMGIPVVEGREFESTDGRGAQWVGVVNEAAARASWPGSSPIGAQVYPMFMPSEAGPVTIVGVVADVRSEGARAPATPELYLPYGQTPGGLSWIRAGSVVARTSTDPEGLVESIREVVRSIDPLIPITDVATLDEVASSARARERFLATVLAVFAGLSLLIAGMGTYGVVTYAIARRTREFGVRIALGAGRGQVVTSVVKSGARLAIAGAGLGLAGAVLLGPALEGLIFGVDARDTVSLAVGPLLMGGLVMLASAVPALRAGRIDPLEALREEA